VTRTLEPLLDVARNRNCHIILLHHAGKANDRTEGDEILGSTALLGAVDTAILLKKRQHGRTFSTIQRYGENIPETVFTLGEDFSITGGGSLKEAQKAEAWEKIQSLLEGQSGLAEKEILEQIKGSKADISCALRWALNQETPLVERRGDGKKGNPFRYNIPCTQPTPTNTEGRMSKTPESVIIPDSILPGGENRGESGDKGKNSRLSPFSPFVPSKQGQVTIDASTTRVSDPSEIVTFSPLREVEI
jgi:hypothetical protein